jgi:hypothetical protein
VIKAFGTFSAAVIMAAGMAISTIPATSSASTFRTADFQVQTKTTSLPFTGASRRGNDVGLDIWTRESVVDTAGDLLRTAQNWHSLLSRSIRAADFHREQVMVFNSAGASSSEAALAVRKSWSTWLIDDVKLVPSVSWYSAFGADGRSVIDKNREYLASFLHEVDPAILDDASVFYESVKGLDWAPNIWSDEGEIAFEWINGEKHAIASIEGDGLIGYTMRRNGKYFSGENEAAHVAVLPADLREYLITA